MTANRHSLYHRAETQTATDSDSNPFPPGTSLTASVETIDNDRAGLMLVAGVLR